MLTDDQEDNMTCAEKRRITVHDDDCAKVVELFVLLVFIDHRMISEEQDSDNEALVKVESRQKQMVSEGCPYMSTVERKMLDFDMIPVCAVTMASQNVYVCLCCGKFLQGNITILKAISSYRSRKDIAGVLPRVGTRSSRIHADANDASM